MQPEFLTTNEAAEFLRRKPQTLFCWVRKSMLPPPLAPIRVQGRLLWPTEQLRALLSQPVPPDSEIDTDIETNTDNQIGEAENAD